jgi:hypothetical protein
MVSTRIVSAEPLPVFLGKCDPCARPLRLVTDNTDGPDFRTINCPECHAPQMGTRLYGTVSDMTCDPMCEGAIGNDCVCACGGINHGGVWSQKGKILADALAKYRAHLADVEHKRTVKREAAEKVARDETAEWNADHAKLVADLLGTDWEECDYPNAFLADLARNLRANKILTVRQEEAAQRTLDKREAGKRDSEARAANAVDVPEERHTFTGIVTAVYEVADNFRPSYGREVPTITKIVVDTGTFRVRGTCPRSIRWHNEGPSQMIAKGDKVTLTATTKPDGKEKGSGYFSRPAKAVYV